MNKNFVPDRSITEAELVQKIGKAEILIFTFNGPHCQSGLFWKLTPKIAQHSSNNYYKQKDEQQMGKRAEGAGVWKTRTDRKVYPLCQKFILAPGEWWTSE